MQNVYVPPPLSCEKLHSKLQHHLVSVCVCVCVCVDGWRSSRKRIGRRRAVTWLWQHFRFKKKGKEGLEHQMRADACWGFGRLRTSRTPPPPRCRLQERRISFFIFYVSLLLLLFHRCDNNLLPSSPANLKPLTYLFFFLFLSFFFSCGAFIIIPAVRRRVHTHITSRNPARR